MKNVQDIYPTSPMQELMLLHTLGRRHSDTLLTQFVFAIDRALDATQFAAAFEAVVARHPMLRTAFVVDKVKAPLQIVRGTVKLPFVTDDWRDRTEADQQQDLAALCRADRAEGFDPRRAPLMRLTLIRVGDTRWRFIWTSHHLLMDRWCLDELFADLDSAYASLTAGRQPDLPRAPSFRQYIDWLSRQDRGRALEFWERTLAGFSRPTPALHSASADDTLVSAVRQVSRSDVHDAARRFKVTPGTLIQAATALTLAQRNQRADVVFGTAAAARPPAIAGVERIVGSFVSNLPVRVSLVADVSVANWLAALQRVGVERSEFEYLSPLDIVACAHVADDQALFDTLLVWLAATERALPFDMRPLNHDLATAYPVTLSVQDGTNELTLHGHLRTSDTAAADALLDILVEQLAVLCRCSTDATLGDLTDLSLPARIAPNPRRAPTPAAGIDQSTDIDTTLNGGREMLSDALLEQLITAQFHAALAVEQVGPDDDFFALGGDSLRAASMHAQICAGTRKNVPLLALFRTPTIRGITRTLRDNDWPMTPGIALPLRSGGDGATLFCIASPEVNTLGYFVLARHLSPEHNTCVLQAPPTTDQPLPMDPEIIEPLARDYVAAMREQQPVGPYRLLGMCGGAHLALAMARQLQSAGESLRFFGIVNTWSLYSVSWVYYLHRARNVARYYAGRIIETLRGGSDASAAPAAPTTNHAPAAGPANEDVGLGSPWIRDVGFARRLPTIDPAVDVVDATAHVFRLPRQQYWRIRDAQLGWGRFFSDTRIVALEGDDHDLLLREPYVAQIAEKMNTLLDGQPLTQSALPDTMTTIKTEPVT